MTMHRGCNSAVSPAAPQDSFRALRISSPTARALCRSTWPQWVLSPTPLSKGQKSTVKLKAKAALAKPSHHLNTAHDGPGLWERGNGFISDFTSTFTFEIAIRLAARPP
ncbi:hypothetical protein GX50_00950 [[Emmonsia] crescens]|uniref:Uncharacterized protein n=1 Tax=[Emmonsia] crescens TaxID=73230 RepID=A0A2B7ZRI3_9EURO|nr:hypothetical protein GX50_00950 [Emmonsia crescens]